MSMWSIFRSPLMFGGNLPSNDPLTLSIITNNEIIAVNQTCSNSRELSNKNGHIIWVADIPDSKDKFVGLFNARDAAEGRLTENVSLKLADIGFTDFCKVRDLWKHKNLDEIEGTFAPAIAYHGAGLYRISPK